ncbi:MAG: hypothetical protein ACOYLB_02670 [Phototrophicaceae bacterium]
MDRRFGMLIVIVAVLIVGGGLTSFIAAEGTTGLLPGMLTVTRIPEASVNQFGENQGLWFALMVGFILFNLVGASLTFAALIWFLDKNVQTARVDKNANHATIQEAFRLNRDQESAKLSAQNKS